MEHFTLGSIGQTIYHVIRGLSVNQGLKGTQPLEMIRIFPDAVTEDNDDASITAGILRILQ